MSRLDEQSQNALAEARSHSDQELIRGSREGDPVAWAQLIDKYKNLIFSIPIKYGFSREDAADIFQEVCLQLLDEIGDIRDPQAFPKWLMTVTSHKCFHTWRSKKRFVRMESEEATGPEPEVEPDALRVLCEAEKEQKLREGMAKLAGRCRQLIEMLFFEEPSRPYKEIASALGIATGSIGFIRQRCLQRLRDRIKEAEQLLNPGNSSAGISSKDAAPYVLRPEDKG